MIIRIISLILVIAFISQDIVWAYPDPLSDRSSKNNKLAPQSLFADQESVDRVYGKILEELIEKSGIPRKNLTLDAVKAVLKKHGQESWFKSSIGYTEHEHEVLITFSSGYILRYYDPDPKFKLYSKYLSQENNLTGLPASAPLNNYLHKQLLKPESPNMGWSMEWNGADTVSDTDTANQGIRKAVKEGQAFEVHEQTGKVLQLTPYNAPVRAPLLERKFASNGTFDKIRMAKETSLLRRILRENKNFHNLSPDEQNELIRTVQNISLSIVLGRSLPESSEKGEEITFHVRTGFSKKVHGLDPTVWIGEHLLDRLTPEELARAMLEETQHIIRPYKWVGGRWINLHWRAGDNEDPRTTVKHDDGFIDYLLDLAKKPRSPLASPGMRQSKPEPPHMAKRKPAAEGAGRDEKLRTESVYKDYFEMLFEFNLELFVLLAKRMKAKRLSDAAALEGNRAEMRECLGGLKEAMAAFEERLGRLPNDLRMSEAHKRAKDKFATAESLIGQDNEPAANAALVAALNVVSKTREGILRARISASRVRINVYKKDGKIVMRQHAYVKADDDARTLVPAYIEKTFDMRWQAGRSLDEQEDGILDEREKMSEYLSMITEDQAAADNGAALTAENAGYILSGLTGALVEEKRLARIALAAVKELVELGETGSVKHLLPIAKRYLGLRVEDIDSILHYLKIGRIGPFRAIVARDNADLISRMKRTEELLEAGRYNAARGNTYGLMKKAQPYLAEPDLKGLNSLIGPVLGYTLKLQKGVSKEEEKAIKGRAKFWAALAKRKLEDSQRLSEFMEAFRTEYSKRRLRGNVPCLKEDAFVDLFESFIKDKQLIRGSPQAKAFQILCYLAVFIPMKIKNPLKTSEEIPNPTFEPINELRLMVDIDDIPTILKVVRLHKITKTLSRLEEFKKNGTIAKLNKEERTDLLKAMAEDHGLKRADRFELAKAFAINKTNLHMSLPPETTQPYNHPIIQRSNEESASSEQREGAGKVIERRSDALNRPLDLEKRFNGLVDKDRALTWNYKGNEVIAEISYDDLGYAFVIRPDEKYKEAHPELAVLDTPADRTGVAPSGSFGQIFVEFAIVRGKPALIIDEVQSSPGYRRLKPNHVRVTYKPWAESAIAKMVGVARSMGIEQVYASTEARIISRYEYETLTPENLWENYTFPFKGKGWGAVTIDISDTLTGETSAELWELTPSGPGSSVGEAERENKPLGPTAGTDERSGDSVAERQSAIGQLAGKLDATVAAARAAKGPASEGVEKRGMSQMGMSPNIKDLFPIGQIVSHMGEGVPDDFEIKTLPFAFPNGENPYDFSPEIAGGLRKIELYYKGRCLAYMIISIFGKDAVLEFWLNNESKGHGIGTVWFDSLLLSYLRTAGVTDLTVFWSCYNEGDGEYHKFLRKRGFTISETFNMYSDAILYKATKNIALYETGDTSPIDRGNGPQNSPINGPKSDMSAALADTASGEVQSMIEVMDRQFNADCDTRPITGDQQILLSENLFEMTDLDNLRRVLGSNKFVKVVPFDAIEHAATNGKGQIAREELERRLGCVVTKTEFEKLCKTYNLKENRENRRATILALDEKLTGSNYLYLEGVVGLVKAMMEKEPAAAMSYMRLLFKDIMIDNAAVTDVMLEDFLKNNDSVEFALRAILAFRPIVKINTEEELNNYKVTVENALMAA